MKKLYVVLLVLCSVMQVNGMETQSSDEVAIEGLDKRTAQRIFESLRKLSDQFAANYHLKTQQGGVPNCTLFFNDLKKNTPKIEPLSEQVELIGNAIQRRNGKDFWQAEEKLRSLLRPTFRVPDVKRAKVVQQGYVSAAVGKITGAMRNFYNWLFSGKGVSVQ